MTEAQIRIDGGPARVTWLDAARGIGILLVVIGHVERGIVSAGIATGPGWAAFDTDLYTFHMPLFMLLAGINVPGSLRRGRLPFLRDKVQNVAYPYVLWSLIQGAILVVLSSFTNGGAVWSDLAMIGWRPMSQFWFLYALFLYLLLVAAIGVRAILLVPIALAGLAVTPLLAGEGVVQRLAYFLIFFVIGILLSEPIKNWRPRAPAIWLAVLLAGWVGCLWLLPAGNAPYMSLLALPCALLGSAFVMLLAQTLSGSVSVLFVKLGAWSMSIYVMHILAASGMRIAMMKAHIDAPAIAYLIVGVIAGIALPVMAHIVLDRLGLLPILGLGKRRAGMPGAMPDRVTGGFAVGTR